jgi:hypothetical protein
VVASGGNSWQWFVDGVKDGAQTGSSYVFAASGRLPGFYTLSLSFVYDGVLYTGSIGITIDQATSLGSLRKSFDRVGGASPGDPATEAVALLARDATSAALEPFASGPEAS